VTDLLPERGVYCNRTVNLRSIRAIGYDMDYTLVHYRTEGWERAAFEQACVLLARRGWPVDGLAFDARSVIQGLAFDLELGNLVKATRFGYVIRAQHGTRLLPFEEQRVAYAGTFVDLAEERWEFMNTLFSLSEASLFAQLVDLLDAGRVPGVTGYAELYRAVTDALDEAHAQGELKARIVADPDAYVELDPEVPLTLLDQRHAGKALLLITNSEWAYTQAMMTYAFDRHLPGSMTWRDLFDMVIVGARKPSFFSHRQPAFAVVDPDRGLLAPHRGPLVRGGMYLGADAMQVEESLGLSGSEILYVGDHLFGDVHVTKAMLRWRTGLVLRELEAEIAALRAFRPTEERLRELMTAKTVVDRRLASLRLSRLRLRDGYASTDEATEGLDDRIRTAIVEATALDAEIAPLARAAGEVGNPTWGPLLRAGNDKSLFARQVERYADLYTSRVANLLAETPFAYLRAARGSLPHDPL
jgi:HAD superfamily 5'-nucleotidase-like hydrolase